MIMSDLKIAGGTLLTAMSITAPSWLDSANLIATLLFTIVVGSLTAWYTWERIQKLRKQRKDKDQ